MKPVPLLALFRRNTGKYTSAAIAKTRTGKMMTLKKDCPAGGE